MCLPWLLFHPEGYRCYHPPLRRFIVTKDAPFDEFLPYYSPPSSESITHSLSPSDPLEFLIPPQSPISFSPPVPTSTNPTPQSSSPSSLPSSGVTSTPEPPSLHPQVSTSTTPAPLSSSLLPSSDNTTPPQPPSLHPPLPSSSNSLTSPPPSPIPPHVPPCLPQKDMDKSGFVEETGTLVNSRLKLPPLLRQSLHLPIPLSHQNLIPLPRSRIPLHLKTLPPLPLLSYHLPLRNLELHNPTP